MTDFAAARKAMVDCQVRPSDVTQYGIIEAMLWAPRERFVPKAKHGVAYAEADIPLDDGRSVMAPRTLAKMISAARVAPDHLVLDLAPGLGYSTAVLARLAAAVIAIEPDQAMAQHASSTLEALEQDNIVVQHGDATVGDPDHGPFDLIFVGGGIEIVPDVLAMQLKEGGQLVAIVMDGAVGQCRVMVKTGGALSERRMFDATAPVLAGFEKARDFAF